MQAFGGVMSTTGEPGRPSVRVGPSIVDMGTGMWAVIGILAALRDRRRHRQGRRSSTCRCSRPASCWVSLLASQYLASGESPGKQGSGASGIVPYKAYATRDGELVVAAGSDGAVPHPGRSAWATPNGQPIRALPTTPPACTTRWNCTGCWTRSCSARTARTGSGDSRPPACPAPPVQSIAQMVAHAQTAALGLVQPVPDSQMRFIGLPLSIDGERPQPSSRPPKLGEHTAELFPDLETP